MTSRSSLRCPKCRRADTRVTVRMANYSKFNGSRYTPSDYSALRCLDCGHPWRSKAKAVACTPSMDDADAYREWRRRTDPVRFGVRKRSQP